MSSLEALHRTHTLTRTATQDVNLAWLLLQKEQPNSPALRDLHDAQQALDRATTVLEAMGAHLPVPP